MPKSITRREFVTAAAVAGASLTAAGATGCAPVSSDGEPVATPSASYGGSQAMSKRVLVGYATGTGSTVGVAEEIGKTMGARGFAVDVKPMKDSPSLAEYDAVVLGSAINGGKWLPEAASFVEAHRDELGTVPVSLFCVHAMNTSDEPKKKERRLAYLEPQRAIVTPACEGFFAGVGPKGTESWFARTMFRTFGGDVEGDGRDWPKIRAWAQDVPV